MTLPIILIIIVMLLMLAIPTMIVFRLGQKVIKSSRRNPSAATQFFFWCIGILVIALIGIVYGIITVMRAIVL